MLRSVVPRLAGLEGQPISKRFPMIDVMLRCTRIMGHEIGQARADEAANIVLTPKLGNINMLEFARSPEIIECGRRVAEENLPAILAGYERLRPRTATVAAKIAAQLN